MSRRPRIAIAGVGVVGSVLARVLAPLQVDVVCFERASALDHSDSGTGLNVGPNGIKALAALAPEIAASLTAESLPWCNWRTSLTDGTILFDLPLALVADRPGIRIGWSQLYRALRTPIADRIQWEHAVEGAGYRRDGLVELTTRNLGTDELKKWPGFDLVIGGDGRYSAIREAFFSAPEPRHFGIALFRALVPDTALGLIDDYEQWFNGPNRLLAYRVPGNRIYIAGAFPIPAGAPIEDRQQTPDYLRALYTPDTVPPSLPCRWLIKTITDPAAKLHWARLQEIDDEYVDEGGRVLLLGDAAHAMVPTLGQGATQAFEDAGVAGLVLREALTSPMPDLRAAAREIARRRRDRVSFAKQFSADATDTMLEGADPVSGTRRKAATPFLEKLASLYQDIPGLEPTPA